MPRIEITTYINAPKEGVFDLARSIDLHMISTQHTNEMAVGGRTSGLIELGETVTWQAKHFGINQKLTVEITEFDRPHYFVDEMRKGAFKSFRHQHLFSQVNDQTEMKDIFDFSSPMGILGNVFNALVLISYMTRLLIIRNNTIKDYAESDKWKQVLKT